MSKKIETKVDGTPLTRSEMNRINELISDLYSPTTVNAPTGHKVREIMEIRGVVSPPINNLIKVSKEPNTWIQSSKLLDSQDDVDKFIKSKKKKYNLK